MRKEQTQCKQCVMDTTAEEIYFDGDGICNFCHQATKSIRETEKEKGGLAEIIRAIKMSGEQYNCLIGLSGGVDSSYTLVKAVGLGLRPLCFSVDNGWNDPGADENIMRLVEGLKVPFFRYTIDLKKFSKLQSAFMRAGQKNLEIPTDHILLATTHEMAERNGIKWILSGGNVATESIMPPSWGYNARDLVHIKDVYRKMTGEELVGLPTCGLLRWNYYKWIKRHRVLYLLDYLNYNRAEAIEEMSKKFGYKDYSEKHCESIYTWWFQNYYLFEKFGIDKRKAHLSSMILSGQITREEAQIKLQENPVYPSLGIEGKALSYKAQPYTNFKTDEKLWNFITASIRRLKRLLRM